MKKKKIGICGSFGGMEKTFDGQTVKTKNYTEQIEKILGKENIMSVNTHFWRKTPLKIFFGCVKISASCQCAVIMPAQNGLRIFTPLFYFLKKIFKTRIYYSVIGGWLPEYIKDKKKIKRRLISFDGIFAETETMRKQLEEEGFDNVSVIPNFKLLTPLTPEQLPSEYSEPYKLCTFSRVMEEKGMVDAARTIVKFNEEKGKDVFLLDIYGMVNESYFKEFKKEIEQLPACIQYKGCADSKDSVAVLSRYFAQVFPTKFYTEGLPGSVIDGFFAGVPVIASGWASCSDIVQDQKNGLIFEFANFDDFYKKLSFIYENPQVLIDMKPFCLSCAEAYMPQRVMGTMLTRMKLQ